MASHENPSVSPQATYWDQNRQASPLSADSHTIGSHTVGRLSADNINASIPPSHDYRGGYDGIGSPGSESVYTDKLKPAAATNVDDAPGNTHPPVDKRICGIRRAWFLLVLIAATCIAIAVGVALGVTLARKNKSDGSKPSNSSSSSNQTGGQSSQPINPSYLSKSGVFNGTGIALAGQSFDSGGNSQTVLYFQHWSGQIRQTQFLDDGTWLGGGQSEIVATDAKNATPISMVSYSANGTNTWHMFYIGKNNTVLERINSNKTNLWQDGPLGQLGLLALDDRNVGLQGCWYGDYYGASTRGNNTSDQQIGIHLWYGSAANKIEELTFVYGSNQWAPGAPILGYNGHAGIGCYSWGGGSVTYLMLVNPKSQVEIRWKELNTTLKSTTTHPVNTWTTATGATFPTVHANTSLGYTVWFFMQNADNTLSGHNISWAAENTTIFNKDSNGNKDSFTISENTGKPSVGLPGTHLSVTALPTKSGGANEFVFYQTDSSNITEFSRDLSPGTGWFSSSVFIPYN